MSIDRAIQSGYTKRYLPEKAWASLSKEEREETERKKRTGSRHGEQFVSNTDKARKAVKLAKHHKSKRK